MKIAEVKTYFLKYELTERLVMAHGNTQYRHAGIVEIITDTGISGWGEGLSVPSKKIIDRFLIGRDPSEIDLIWNDIAQLGWGVISFLSGIDIALHDLAGKVLDLPVHTLLSSAPMTKIKAYASGLLRKNDSSASDYLLQEAQTYVEMGFDTIKMKVGFGKEQDIKNVISVREHIGKNIKLAIDANCGYSIEDAVTVGKTLEPYDIAWFEEPTDIEDINGYLKIKKQLHIPLSGGELLRGKNAFKELLLCNALDIVQPDVSIAGGISECRNIAELAYQQNILVMPHMWGGILRLAATIHLISALPITKIGENELLLEYDMSENPFRTDLAYNNFTVNNSFIEIPNVSGLGIEINRDKIDKYRVNR